MPPPPKIYRGIYCANLYNEPSNTNTNIGAALSYSLRNNPL